MDMHQSEKNLLEKLADAIPGLKGYRDKEARRDTDKRFRDYLAARIEGVRANLDTIKEEQLAEGKLDELDDLDRLGQRLIKIASAIRHASYGYSGFFDQVNIQEAELDRIYQYDLSLLGDVEVVETAIRNDPARSLQEQRKQWESTIADLDKRIQERKNLFTVINP